MKLDHKSKVQKKTSKVEAQASNTRNDLGNKTRRTRPGVVPLATALNNGYLHHHKESGDASSPSAVYSISFFGLGSSAHRASFIVHRPWIISCRCHCPSSPVRAAVATGSHPGRPSSGPADGAVAPVTKVRGPTRRLFDF